MAKNLGKMLWKSDVYKNVKIVIDNKYVIKAHKCVLGLRSLKFAKMFEQQSVSDETTIFIQNSDYDTVKEAVMHCYDMTNSDIISAEGAINLLNFAAEYEIEDLKDNMEELCIENLSVFNVTSFANASMITKSDKLKIACLEFLSKCMETHSFVKNFEILNADMKEFLFLESFVTVLE